ncbi:MAG: SBBP repeat-containing protein [candidate division Zixibacteria bacterium]|nr:SBBP repeat-containing protein [candidate division Zixibacteria bacterium]
MCYTLKIIMFVVTFVMTLTAQTVYSQKSVKSVDLNDNLSNVQITRSIASMPLAFTMNHGQWDSKVLFRTNSGGATAWFTSNGVSHQFIRRIDNEDNRLSDAAGEQISLALDESENDRPDSFESMTIKASFVGANPNPQMIGVDMMEYKCNYFIGNDPNEWHTDVPNYTAVLYEQIYDGIDLKYYGNGKQMEYDFIVSPGADYSQIEIEYEGAESISINDNGDLVVETKWGKVIEQRPLIYQIENNSRVAVTGEYRIMGDNTFGFELSSSYNPALSVVIDPLLSYSTYLGGSNGDNSPPVDRGLGIAVDGSGNAYITGQTWTTDFPTVGEYQTNQVSFDAFVTKLNSSGNALV